MEAFLDEYESGKTVTDWIAIGEAGRMLKNEGMIHIRGTPVHCKFGAA
jgi:hypothetical protein